MLRITVHPHPSGWFRSGVSSPLPAIPEKKASSPLFPSSVGPLLWWRIFEKLNPTLPLPPSPRLLSPGTKDPGSRLNASSTLSPRPAPPPLPVIPSSSSTATPAAFPSPFAATAARDILPLPRSSSSSSFSPCSSLADDGLPARSRSTLPPPKTVSAAPCGSRGDAAIAGGLGGCGSRCRRSAEVAGAPPGPSCPTPTTSSSFSLSRKDEKLSAA